MTPHPWFSNPFSSEGEDPQWMNQRQYVNKIIFVRPNYSPKTCYNDLRRCNVKRLKYLKGLNAFIGQFPKNSTVDAFGSHPDVYQIDDDIQVKIFIPIKGKVVSKPQVTPWGIKRIGADRVWNVTQGRGIRVGVIDTGIAFDHPDLSNNVKGGVNILSPLLPPYDHNGHGTHISGTIGAVNNRIGVVGVAPNVSLYAVKAFKKDGTANLSDIMKAIDWCIEHRMNVINMSFGFNEPSPTFREAIRRAHQAGIIMVSASGNKGTRGRLEYPAQFDETIAVSSINEENKISKFSTIGPGVDLAAPGEKITSTWLNNSYRELSGTSMSVAHVSGAAALMLSRYPDLSVEETTYFLKNYASRLQGVSSLSQGSGVVNISNLANEAVDY